MKRVISTARAPKAIGPYSQAIAVGNTVYVSGQIPVDPELGTIPEGIQAQTELAIQNLCAILNEYNMALENVVKTTVFMANLNDFAVMNQIYEKHFPQPYPARSAIQIARLPKDSPIEIECIAVKF